MNEPPRNCDPRYLHPVFRQKAADLLRTLAGEGMPFRLFEGYRTFERQRYLYAQGRTRPGPVVTRARPGMSYHQYGLAGDFVLFENGKWSWDAADERARWWERLRQAGRELGLEPLAFEAPHLQFGGWKIEELMAGRYPEGGDATWLAAIRRPRLAA
jgi:peptidoglycan L-alanyl-D-glutamate endopeptidase CwlK